MRLRRETLNKLAVAVLAVLAGSSSVGADEAATPVLLDGSVVMVRNAAVDDVIALPEGRIANRLEPLAHGWIAGGLRPTPEGAELFLIESAGGETRYLSPPAPDDAATPAAWRAWAVPVVEDGVMRGLLWLEGERHNRLAVRAAEWSGTEWGPTEPVSAPGPGSQVALSGAVLGDGSWLAVWTWVDEQGDAETVWSLRQDQEWSAPLRVHEDNAVHDVQPVLAAVEGGAVVAWTTFDGEDYRMRRARFDGRSWEVSSFFGGRGAANPSLVADPVAGRTHLLYATVAPATWSIVELDSRGMAIAKGAVERDLRDGEPVLLARDAAGAVELVRPSFKPEFPERREPVLFEALDPGDPGDPGGL